MARIARRALRIKELPLFSLRQPFPEIGQPSGELALNMFEDRYVELVRRLESGKSPHFGYTAISQRRVRGRGVLLNGRGFRWVGSRKSGPVVLQARALDRFRILSIRSEVVKEGSDPLYIATVQTFADRDLSRMQTGGREHPALDTIWGQVYVQAGGGLGFASYHFHPGECYISYERANDNTFPKLDDGSQPPAKKYFEEVAYDPGTRCFRGVIDWSPSSWQGDEKWVYNMVFSADLDSIVAGTVHAIPANKAKQTKELRFGVNLHYRLLRAAWIMPDDVKEALMQSGVAASDVEAALGAAEAGSSTESSVPASSSMMSRRRTVRWAKAVALNEKRESWSRLEAIGTLKRLGTPPVAVPQAEDALFSVLLASAEQTEGELQSNAEDALRACWEDSGDAKVNAEMARGIELLDDQKADEAIESFTRVTEMAPNFAEGFHKLSIAHYAKQEFEKAVEDCRQALKLQPRHYWCLTGMGSCYWELDEKQKARECWEAALEIFPAMPGAQSKIEEAELKDIMDEHLRPVIDRFVNGFQTENAELATVFSGDSHWDVHRLKIDRDNFPDVWAYFFRVSVRRPCRGEGEVKSRARFYVLRGDDGKVFPFTRPTIGESSFSLNKGDEYKFCWCLLTGRELQRAAAGMLLEGSADGRPEFHSEELPILFPMSSPEIDPTEASNLGDGYTFTGHLDLRAVAGF